MKKYVNPLSIWDYYGGKKSDPGIRLFEEAFTNRPEWDGVRFLLRSTSAAGMKDVHVRLLGNLLSLLFRQFLIVSILFLGVSMGWWRSSHLFVWTIFVSFIANFCFFEWKLFWLVRRFLREFEQVGWFFYQGFLRVTHKDRAFEERWMLVLRAEGMSIPNCDLDTDGITSTIDGLIDILVRSGVIEQSQREQVFREALYVQEGDTFVRRT